MSYCRAGADSDVYLMRTGGGAWWCAGCDISENKGYTSSSREDVIAHLEAHRAAGGKVPERAFERLRREAREEAAT